MCVCVDKYSQYRQSVSQGDVDTTVATRSLQARRSPNLPKTIDFFPYVRTPAGGGICSWNGYGALPADYVVRNPPLLGRMLHMMPACLD